MSPGLVPAESKSSLWSAYDSAPFGVMVLQAVRGGDGSIVDFAWTYVNPAAERLLNRPAAELLGARLLEILPGNRTNPDLFQRYVQAAESGQDERVEFSYERDGIAGWFRGSVVRQDDGVVVYFSDITQLKQAEAERRASEARLQVALTGARMGPWEWDFHSGVITWSASLEAIHGLEPGTFEGTFEAYQRDIHPDDRDRVLATIAQTVAEERDHQLDYRIVRPDGSVRWLEARGQFLRDESGRATGLTGVCIDVTARKLAEQAGRESEAFLRRVLDSLFAFVGLLSPDGTLLEANRAPLEAAGIGLEDVVGRKFWDCYWWSYAPAVQQQLREAVERAARGEVVRYDVEVRMAGGHLMTIDFMLAPLRDELGRISHLIPSGIDITERKRTERRLQELLAREQAVTALVRAAEARYRALVEQTADAVLLLDHEGRYLDANESMLRLVGYSLSELRQMRLGSLAASPSMSGSGFAELQRDGTWRGEVELRRKDGSTVAVEGQATRIEGAQGPLYLVAWRDISERRALERLQQEFLAMAAHELRNPLAGLSGYAQLLRRRGEYNERSVSAIITQVERLERLVTDLLDASRLQIGRLDLRPEPLDLAAEARAAADQARGETERHTIRFESAVASLPVQADRTRLGQVLTNLLSNAIKYSPEGGEIVIRVERCSDEARVSVRDHGIGLAPESLERVFERYFRARPGEDSAGGLGLGLTISRGIIEAHGGRIWAESQGTGLGSQFVFTLPTADPPRQ